MAKKSNKQNRVAFAGRDKLNIKPIIISAILTFILLAGLMVTFLIFMLPTEAESIAFRENEINIRPGQTLKPEVIVLPVEAVKKDYRIVSSNPAICSVTPYNEIRGESKGEVTITATLVSNDRLFTSIKVSVIDTTTIEGADDIPKDIKTNQEINLNGVRIFEGSNMLATTAEVTPTQGRIMVSPGVFKFETAGERKITFQAFDSSSIRRQYTYTLRVYDKVHISVNKNKASKISAIESAETTAQLVDALGITAVDDFGVVLDCTLSITDDASQQIIESDAIVKGGTYTISISATDVVGNSDSQVFENIAVYGVPTVSFGTDSQIPVREDMRTGEVDFYEVDGEYTLDINRPKFTEINEEYFGLVAIDSFGVTIESSAISLTKPPFVDAGSDRYQMTLTVTDLAGNSVSTPIKLRVFSSPRISCNPKFGDLLATGKYAHIRLDDYTHEDFDIRVTQALGLKVTDCFGGLSGNLLSLVFDNQAATAGDTVNLTITATDKLGNIAQVIIECKLYETPVVNYSGDQDDLDEIIINATQPNPYDALNTMIDDMTSADSFGGALQIEVIVKDSTDNPIAFDSFEELAIGAYTISFTATDLAGNIGTLRNSAQIEDIPFYIYGDPEIVYEGLSEVHVKLEDVLNKTDDEIRDRFNITAQDSMDNDITMSISLVITQYGTENLISSNDIIAGSSYRYTFTFTAQDSEFNTSELELTVYVYEPFTISNSGTTFKSKLSDVLNADDTALATLFGLRAQDTYENALAFTLDSITDNNNSSAVADTTLIEAGESYSLEFTATDNALNTASIIITIEVYGAINVETNSGLEFNMNEDAIRTMATEQYFDLFGIRATDSLGVLKLFTLESITNNGSTVNQSSVEAGNTYELVFTVSDPAQNTASVTITVNIFDAGDLILTVSSNTLTVNSSTVTIDDLKQQILLLVTVAKDSFDAVLAPTLAEASEAAIDTLSLDGNNYIDVGSNSDISVTIQIRDLADNTKEQTITVSFTLAP